MSEYPYCPHGVFVGGCGIDYMCQACELGDAEPTPAEQADYVRRIYSKRFDPQFGVTSIVPTILSMPTPGIIKAIPAFLNMMQNALSELGRERAFLEEIRRYARHEDDAQWIYKRQGERRAEWDAMNDTQQFQALPDVILDGA